MPEVDRKALRELLRRWQTGDLTPEEVHREAEAMYEAEEWPELPDEDPRSIGLEVLTQLDILNHQLITEADIPAMLEFLSTAVGDEADGWAKWRAYWEHVNLDERREELRHNSFYST